MSVIQNYLCVKLDAHTLLFFVLMFNVHSEVKGNRRAIKYDCEMAGSAGKV